jgi:acyl-[acyl-carrier-protein]-phospholipid O-acyltransferase/long-chain-fatty-acid--[acyl-carrier-protein] ligase
MFFGISAGLFSLPLQTFIQYRSESDIRGEVLAASSFINWVGILLASGVTYLFSGPLRLAASLGFSLLGCLTLILAMITFWRFPDILQRSRAMLAGWLKAGGR